MVVSKHTQPIGAVASGTNPANTNSPIEKGAFATILRMNVKNLIPNPAIAEYVERILVIESYKMATPFLLPLFANGSPTLVFSSVKGTIKNNNTSHLTLFGQTILPETFVLPENFTFIAYFFKPYAIGSIFRVMPKELTDRPVDLNLLALKKTNGLQEQLLNACTTEKIIALLDNYISGLIVDAKKDYLVLSYAANTIAQNSSAEVLSLVQKELCMTERTFQRMFEKNIGIAPTSTGESASSMQPFNN
jgi:AraC-like DNA-binding protein